MTEFSSKDNYFIDGSGTRSKAWNRVANSGTGILAATKGVAGNHKFFFCPIKETQGLST